MRRGDTTKGRCSVLALVVAVAGCSAVLAACGSTSNSSNRSSPGEAAAIKFADCMRSHGVPNLSDSASGEGIQIQAGSGINPESPAFKAAQAHCRPLLPPGRPGGAGPPSEQTMEQMLAVSKCMRAHGVSGFPDPTVGPPPANPQDFSIAMGRGGVSLLVPKTIDVSSPAFKQAATACHFGTLIGAGQRTPVP